ncbi:MAG: hypothetical protein H0V89_00020 [Deltaproteobacteria bacterium]|nr:hypothetical protein [Deltaproteobacteria bacterium]
MLASAYRASNPAAYLTHSYDRAAGRVLCGRVKAENTNDDPHASPADARPTCPTCLKHDPRFPSG